MMKCKKPCLIALCLSLAFAAECRKKPAVPPEDLDAVQSLQPAEQPQQKLTPPPAIPENDMAAAANGINAFALDLYRKVGKEKKNLFFSPFSISMALAMTSAGAGGDTLSQMMKTLRFDLEGEALHKALAALSASMESEKNVLRVANRLWGQDGVSFLQPFLDATKTHYGAELQTLDFVNATEEARKTINTWVEEKTENRIKELIKPGMLSKLNWLVLTNAIYFKGTWEDRFDKAATRDEDFTLLDGSKVKVPMMHGTKELRYFENEDVQVLEIPYSGGDMSMVIILPVQAQQQERTKSPDQAGLLAGLEEKLTQEHLGLWLLGLMDRKVETCLPRFTMTSEFLLGETLRSMGMDLAFSEGADFKAMTNEETFFLSEVIHKAFVDVNEEGTEAAAATAVLVKAGGPPEPPPVFRADRPFVFFIKENGADAILFMGRVTNPAG
jgi:serpin B